MSVFRVQLDDYGVDDFRLPVSCGGRSLVFRFQWDQESQLHYDNIQLALAAIASSNPLALSTDPQTTPNTDFIAYITELRMLCDDASSFISRRAVELTISPGTVDWAALETETDSYVSSFLIQHISFNNISKLQEFQLYLQTLLVEVEGEDAPGALAILQAPPTSLFEYAHSYDDYILDITAQQADLVELMYWAVSVQQGEDTYMTALEPGGVHFDQDPLFSIIFYSALDKIGHKDIGKVVILIGVNDGLA